MRNFMSMSGSGSLVKLSIVALFAGGTAACSSDTSRFGDPNSSPYSAQGAPNYTGSVAAAPSGAVQRGAIQSAAGYGAPVAPNSPYGSPQAVASAPLHSPQAPSYPAQQSIYGAPTQQAVAAAPAPAPAPQIASAGGGSHVVASGETLSSISRNYGIGRAALASANGLDINSQVRIGQSLIVPGAGGSTAIAAAPRPAATPAVATAPAPAATPVVAAAPKPAPVATPAATPAVAAAAEKPQMIAAVKPAESADDVRTGAGPQFRWPVRGRVISGFGPKPGGQQNEGINVSVPEGTSVKAAEDGVVAYAGSELKGYGNLVLIKHSDGYVTAYAHNSQLDVKKGDTVRRGQIIAKAGQTGSVSSPQVHFEIRKGSQPVDPSRYLAGL